MAGRYVDAARIPEIQRLPPDSVLHAVKTLYACAVTCVIRAIIYVLTLSATQAVIGTPRRVMLITAVMGAALAAAGLLVWIARLCESGKNWARIAGTVICVIGLSGAIYDLGSGHGDAARAFSGVEGLKGLVVLVLLWLGSSNDYFRSCKRPRCAPGRPS